MILAVGEKIQAFDLERGHAGTDFPEEGEFTDIYPER